MERQILKLETMAVAKIQTSQFSGSPKNLRIFQPQTSASYIFLDKIAEGVPKPRFLTLNQSQRMMSSLEQKIKM